MCVKKKRLSFLEVNFADDAFELHLLFLGLEVPVLESGSVAHHAHENMHQLEGLKDLFGLLVVLDRHFIVTGVRAPGLRLRAQQIRNNMNMSIL